MARAPRSSSSGARSAAQTAAQTEVLPGYWEYTTSAVGQRDTEQKCVRPSEINRFFGGLSELEISALLDRSERSVRRDWQKGRMFLRAALKEAPAP